MKKGEMLNKMLVLATNRHANQYDKSGAPYVLHVIQVMQNLHTTDEELQCIALGHDLFEDTKTTRVELYELGMTERVVNGILSVTKFPGESYDEYKEKVKANPDGRKVKMADLQHNSDIRRLKGVSEKDIERMAKYHRFYLELQAIEN